MRLRPVLALTPVVGSIVALEVFRAYGIELPGGLVQIVAITVSAMLGGVQVGLVAAAIALAHGARFLTLPGHEFQVRASGPIRVRVLMVAGPVMAVMAGLLRLRAQVAMTELGLANRTLEKEVLAKKQLAARLSALLEEQKRRARDITILGEMSSTLQSCETNDEASRLLSGSLALLFPEGGALYSFNALDAPHDKVELLAKFGNTAPPATFAPDACWALRRGRPHHTGNAAHDLRCGHLDSTGPGSDFCWPLMAEGEPLGMLHLHVPPGHVADAGRTEELGQSTADHLALGLGNLALRQRLTIQALRDPLTGLLNRWAMLDVLTREVLRAARKARPLSVIMIDVDHFKTFNDSYGHAAGDTALRELGRHVGAFFRGDDVICRYGGEELVAILPEADLEQASARAEALRKSVGALPLSLAGNLLPPLTVSIGVASLPDHGSTVEELLHRADAALYRAKRAGRDRVFVAGGTSTSGEFPSTEPGTARPTLRLHRS